MSKYIFLLCCLLLSRSLAAVTPARMEAIYQEVRTPYKYGLVVAPQDNRHKIDCPTVYRLGGRWFMTYVCYNGKDGLDGRGYETWLASSDDLLHWKTLGRVLSYRDQGWDMNQRGGFPSLIDWQWGGSYEPKRYKGRYWMTYIGGHGTGYEAVREPLNIGLAWTKQTPDNAHEWQTLGRPLLSIHDKDVQWWEKLVQYKSTVYEDRRRTLGHRFVMFYNAGGVNPANGLKAERIGIALSDDMRHWQRYAGNPVFAQEAAGIITGDAQIVDMGDCYVMFYFSAYDPTRRYHAYNTFAVSTDLVHWEKWKGADLIIPSKPYDDLFAHKSYVLKYNGIVYHYYCAVNKAGQRGIAVATSEPLGRSSVRFPVPDVSDKRQVMSLDKGWTVRFLHTNHDDLLPWKQKDNVTIPNNLDDYYGYLQQKHGNLHGSAVYSRQLNIHLQTGKRYFLFFEGVGTYATLKVNGQAWPRHIVGRTTWTVDITPALRDGSNDLEILVDHPLMITDAPWVCGGCSSEWGFSEGSQPFGIFRPVSLVVTDEVRVEPFGVHVWSNEACDSVFIDTEVKNYGASAATFSLVNKLNDADGKTFLRLTEAVTLAPGETRILHQQQAVGKPHRWSPDDPYLYTLASMIKRSGATTDLTNTAFGFRTLSWPQTRAKDDHPGQFLINGKPFFINGTCDYEHLFGQSHAFSHEEIAARVKWMRLAGFNAFREAHQPHNLYYQQLFDEQGIPFWSQFSAHIWYDTPAFREHFKQLLRQYIRERRNSPSIILWGLQNESVLPKEFAEECTQIIREMDPTASRQRLVTTCNGGEGTDWNVIQNWSGTYGGDPNRYGEELKSSKELLNGEYGAWRILGLHGKDRQSEESAMRLLATKVTQAEGVRDSVCGHFQWLLVSHENPGRVQPDESVRRIDKVGPFNHKGPLSPWEQPTEAWYWYRDHELHAVRDTLTPTAADHRHELLKPAADWRYLYRVNCGGDDYTDSYGNRWMRDDTLFSTSWAQRFHRCPWLASQGIIDGRIHGAGGNRGESDATLFRFFRWGRHALTYHFLLVDNNDRGAMLAADTSLCRVELYFAEPWIGARYGAAIDGEDMRIFSVAVNDSVVLPDVDLWAESGYAGATKKVVYVRPRNGKITISFPDVKVGEAVISAVAVAVPQANKTAWCVLELAPLPEGESLTKLFTDTVARLPKSELPVEPSPSVSYQPTAPGQWMICPGVAKVYALRFRYQNKTGKSQTLRLRLTDSKGMTLVDRPMLFPPTPGKWKWVSTVTDSQINAGQYRVIVDSQKDIVFDKLEIQ
jgi:predicted GH43/DUF377 family glycosyl hydrolase